MSRVTPRERRPGGGHAPPPFARVALALTVLILTFSRVSLLAHEFVGHGAAAVGLGGTITDYRLFLFAGGRVGYARDEPFTFAERLFVSTGGITIELVLAALALLIALRLGRGTLARTGLCAYATGNAVHAVYYLAVGIHYGIADGAMIHRLLSPALRLAVVVPLVALAGVIAYLCARTSLFQLWPQVAGMRRPRAAVALAIVIGLAVHAGLTIASLRIERDQTYAALMKPQVQRGAELAVARARAAMQRQGRPVDPRALRRVRQRYVDEHRTWPLRPLLIVVILVAGAAALWRVAEVESREGSAADAALQPWSWRSLAWAGGVLAASLIAVALLRAPF